jgi:hypothetical protein
MKRLKLLRFAFAQLRNFPNPDRPFFAPCVYLNIPYIVMAQKNPGAPPFANRYIHPQNEEPWGVGRNMPTQSRLTFKISVVCPTADVNKNASQFQRSKAISKALS